MTMRTALAPSLLLASLLGGCWIDPLPAYFTGVYPGTGSYTATLPANPTGLVGAAPITATLDGASSVTFADDCRLVIASASIDDGRDGPTSGDAEIAPRQKCQLPVDGGDAVFTIEDGSLTRTGDYALDASFGGALSSWQGTATAGGYVTFSMHGSWAHN